MSPELINYLVTASWSTILSDVVLLALIITTSYGSMGQVSSMIHN